MVPRPSLAESASISALRADSEAALVGIRMLTYELEGQMHKR